MAQKEIDCNTKKKEVNFSYKRCRNWFLTLNNYTEEDIKIILAQNIDKYVFQEEIGKEGTKHIQGVFSWENPIRFTTLKNLLPKGHWERCKNINAAKKYCSKIETSCGRRWRKGFRIPKIVYDVIQYNTPRRWQQLIIDTCRNELKSIKMVSKNRKIGEKENRRIHWIWESKGNTGKTALAKHLVLKYNAIVVGGSHKDAFFAIQQRLEKDIDIDIVVFDVPRGMMNRISYIALEKIKDGLFFSSKYESGMCIFDPPVVIVFANFEPEIDKLSKDRWNIIAL